MALTDTAVRNAKPDGKTKKLFDARGLYLEVAPAGGKWWRLKYRFGGKEKRLSLGVYPDISLKQARERRDRSKRPSEGQEGCAGRASWKQLRGRGAGVVRKAHVGMGGVPWVANHPPI